MANFLFHNVPNFDNNDTSVYVFVYLSVVIKIIYLNVIRNRMFSDKIQDISMHIVLIFVRFA